VGCAYIPIDPTHPTERIADILSIAQPALVVTDRILTQGCGARNPIVLEASPSDTQRPLPKLSPYDPNALFCIIFTSGTTGQPKGAMITTAGITNALQFSERHFHITAHDRFLAITGWHHDMSLFDIWGPLTTGGTVIFPDPHRDIDPSHWLELIEQHKVSLWNSVPRFMEILINEVERRGVNLPATVRQVILGGDWIPTDLPQRLRDVQPDIQVTSVGGPTETTLWNIKHNAFERPEDCPSIPYGRPIDNCRYYILDSALRDCPDWMPGEMYCAGVGISPGYFGDSTLTQEKFIFHPQKNEHLYRTGDRGCYRPDGTIEFLGRCDFQINLGGYRADVMEIEKVITSYPNIQDAVVVAHTSGHAQAQLIAFYRATEGNLEPEELRLWCEKRLPAPLVPRNFQRVEHYPLTINGKVDRLTLATQPLHIEDQSCTRAPETPLECFIASLWHDILGQPVTHVNASYFELGGDSLKAMAIFLKIEETLGIRPPLSLIFTRSTVGSFAQGILEIISARARALTTNMS
jgi:amino acid adenylation domain-containing protein